MKKNAMLKIAAVLLVAVLLTTCAISSTFAKYVSEGGTYQDTARVAAWGITADISTTEKMFAVSYDALDVANKKEVLASQAVIAPGTSGQITLDANVTGTPEVAFKLNVTGLDANGDPSNKFIHSNNSELLKQLTWKIGDTPYTCDTIDQAIADHFNTAVYYPGQTYTVTDSIVISWEWSFDGDDNDTGFADKGYTIDFGLDLDVVQVGD